MILADTNILIDYHKGQDRQLISEFDSLEIAICGPIKSEVLHGALTDDEADNMIKSFSSFELITVDEYDWEFAGLMLQTFRRNGYQVPVTDALIAYIAIKYDIPIWTKDHHFKLMQAVYPELKLYEMQS